MPAIFVSPGKSASPFLGVQRRITTPAPAVGVDPVFTFPGGAWWRVITARGTYTADANVATRVPRLRITDGTVAIGEVTGSSTLVAADTAVISILSGLTPANTVGSPKLLGFGLPDTVFPAGYALQFVTALIQVGDQWSPIEWLLEEIDLGPQGDTWGAVMSDANAGLGERA